MKLYPHQIEALKQAKGLNRCAFYHDMGLGKTFTGGEKLHELGAECNLIICQKSKIRDWVEHMKAHYDYEVYDLTKPKQLRDFMESLNPRVGVINYDLVWRREELRDLETITLMLDESSLIQNESTKRCRAIFKLDYENVILLSGTPCAGRYENLWSQMRLLGWEISKKDYYSTYIKHHYDTSYGFPLLVIDGYKHIRELKRHMREYGCQFLKTREVIDLPEQVHQTIYTEQCRNYKIFCRSGVVNAGGKELVGDTLLTQFLYERQLCGQYDKGKLEALKDLLESTEDRVIVFYNFTAELYEIDKIVKQLKRSLSVVNGEFKSLENYEEKNNSVTCIQYQAGAMGLNLQKANKIVYFTPPLSSDLFEQSKKRIHRIGQEQTCHYYYLTVLGSIEEKIYKTLAERKDYTDRLFKEGRKHE